MLKQNITLGTYPYYTELFDADIDMSDSYHYDNFIMLRLFNIVNDIAVDTDIYFIEKNTFNILCEELKNNENEISSKIAFPVPNTQSQGFSNAITLFDDNITYNNIQHQFYNLYENDGETLANIKCNKVRIYHPTTKNYINGLIYIDNYINNIHFHYICQPYNNFNVNSTTEIKINNQIYSEYIEIYIPNIYSLFKHDILDDTKYNVYYKEDINIVYAPESKQYIEDRIKELDDEYITYDDAQNIVTNQLIDEIINGNAAVNDSVKIINKIQLVPLQLIIQPSRIIEKNGTYCKLFLINQNAFENNYITYPINITIFPYSEIDNVNKLYVADENMISDTETFISHCNIELAAHMGFNNGNVSIITNFKYPNEQYFKNLVNTNYGSYSAPALAYLYYNNVSPILYNNFSELKEKMLFENIDAITYNELTDYDKQQVEEYIKNYKLITNKDDLKYILNTVLNNQNEMLNAYKDMKKNAIKSELEAELDTDINFIGFKITIASDSDFVNIIYQTTEHLNIDTTDVTSFSLDDFAFQLNGIFNDWNQMPQHVVARIEFIDRMTGNDIVSNIVIITKEWFKYIVNKSYETLLPNTNHDAEKIRYNELRAHKLNSNRVDDIYNINKDMKDINLTENTFNFLNNVTCIINKETDATYSNSGKLSTKLMLKPYFYRANDLQNIQIRSNVTQNIGINLVDYMTKVDGFIVSIEGNSFTEIGRNDIYVIFEIKASVLNETGGRYDVTDLDGNYISTGRYTIY